MHKYIVLESSKLSDPSKGKTSQHILLEIKTKIRRQPAISLNRQPPTAKIK